MYFVETKATSHLPFFGDLPMNTYLSVVSIAAVAKEFGGIKIHPFLQIFSRQKCRFSIILYLLILALAINTALKTASKNPH
jgi:hypothetical protein